ACWERVRFLGDDATGANPRHVEVWRQRATAFSGLTYLRYAGMGLTHGAEHPRLTSSVVTIPNLFDILEVHALVGRTFVPEDGVEGHDNVAVLSYPLWQDLFHGDPGVVGATIRLGDPAWPADRRAGALGAWVQPMQEAVVGDSRTALWLLMASVLGLMLIACLNLANAQLGRALTRSRESAVRAALGAAKWRLIWTVLAENLLLAALGGAAGILLAKAALDLFMRDTPVGLPRLSEIHLNLNVLLFSTLLTFGASLVSALLPALRLLATDPQASLQQSS